VYNAIFPSQLARRDTPVEVLGIAGNKTKTTQSNEKNHEFKKVMKKKYKY